MKYFVTVILLATAALMTNTSAVVAQTTTISVNCNSITRTACEVAKAALTRAPYVGPIRPASEPMACARVVSYGPVPVVWINGTSGNFRSAPVIVDTGIVYTETFGLNDQWTVTESCVPRRLLDGISNLTLCTGQAGDYHWALTRDELREMKRTGHFTSYVPFLTVHDRDSLSVRAVTALYKMRYFARITN